MKKLFQWHLYPFCFSLVVTIKCMMLIIILQTNLRQKCYRTMLSGKNHK